MLEIVPMVLGPVRTNTYLVADPVSGEAAVIDPAWDGQQILQEARQRAWHIGQIWLTHAHFDHLGGCAAVAAGVSPAPSVGLHREDHPLWLAQGGAPLFGLHVDPGPEPTLNLAITRLLLLGDNHLEVRHTPGHTAGHVVFYCPAQTVVFCGDLIFQNSVGRTDLPGGNYATLLNSIRTQILTLPDDTRLLPGHGAETRVGIERVKNPFLGRATW